jgi:hypothetical protein
MTKEEEIMGFLHERVFDPILQSPDAPESLKQGARLTITRMSQRDAVGMMQYYWSAIVGTERSINFAEQLRHAGFIRFEEVIDDFRRRFTDEWLRS